MTNARCVVVTGGAGALGSAVVRLLVARGRPCVALDRERSKPALAQLTAEFPGKVLGLTTDVSTLSGWNDALHQAQTHFGPITGAVLTAGGWQGGALFYQQDETATQSMMQRNFETVQVSLRALLPGMVERKDGSIVVLGSRAVERPWTSTGAANYAASKAAVVALAQAVAQEVLESGVRVNAVLPSTLDTPANRAAMPHADPSRWVSTASLAAVIAFLLSEDARDISGASLPVYGRS